MSLPSNSPAPSAKLEVADDGLRVTIAGRWQITATHPNWDNLSANTPPARVKFVTTDLMGWDSSLVLFAASVANWCRAHGVHCNLASLPPVIRKLVTHFEDKTVPSIPSGSRPIS